MEDSFDRDGMGREVHNYFTQLPCDLDEPMFQRIARLCPDYTSSDKAVRTTVGIDDTIPGRIGSTVYSEDSHSGLSVCCSAVCTAASTFTPALPLRLIRSCCRRFGRHHALRVHRRASALPWHSCLRV